MLRRRGERSARSGGEGTRAHAWPSPPIRPPGGRLRAQDRRIHRWSDWRARGRMPRATRKGRTGHGWQCGREMAGAGEERPQFPKENVDIVSPANANCSAFSKKQLEQLAIAVGLVASIDVPDHARPLVLKRVMQFLAQQQPVDFWPKGSERAGQ
jgi:hypothetical protein